MEKIEYLILKDMEEIEAFQKVIGKINEIIEYNENEKVRINEVLHEIVSTMYDGTMGDTQTINYLHEMIDEKLVD